ncbi:hypothetical protein TB1_007293 [Malus domestica]
MIVDSLEKWHEKLRDTLWAYKTSKRVGIETTPYALTFGQDVVLPMEINVSFIRIQNQFRLHSEKYIQVMCQKVEDLDVARIEALNKIQKGKKAVSRAYNKKVKLKNFKEEELAWKAILPWEHKSEALGSEAILGRVISLSTKYWIMEDITWQIWKETCKGIQLILSF